MTKRKNPEDLIIRKATPEKIAEMIRLNESGMSDRHIADTLNVHHRTVGTYLRAVGKPPNGIERRPIKLVGENKAECSRCHVVKPLNDWPIMRRNGKSPYRMSFCGDCRKKQTVKWANSSDATNVRSRWNRLKVRARKYGIVFSITYEQFQAQWDSQKGLCFYTDESVQIEYGKGTSDNSFSVDKIIPELGYVPGNIVIASNRANTIKYNMSLNEMKKWTPDWYQRVIKFQNQP